MSKVERLPSTNLPIGQQSRWTGSLATAVQHGKCCRTAMHTILKECVRGMPRDLVSRGIS